MTTGSITIGAMASDFYYSKSWSGANGRSTDNAYTCTIVRRRRSKSKLRPPNHGAAPQYYADVSVVPPSPWTANDTIELQGKLVTQIKGHDFNAAIAVAEGRETVNLVKNTALAVFRSIRSLKRGDLPNAMRHLGHAPAGKKFSASVLAKKDISSQWLAISYGWQPLLQDVYEAAKAFEVITAPPRVFQIQVSRTISRKQEFSTSPSNWKSVGNRVITKRYNYTLTEDLAQTPRSLGLLNPLPALWEVVPFSFIADWFIPIGDYLNVVSATPPHMDIRVRLGEKDSLTAACSGSNLTTQGAAFYDGLSFSDSFTRIVVTRTPGAVLSTPAPSFNSISDVYSTKRALNAVALLHQLFT